MPEATVVLRHGTDTFAGMHQCVDGLGEACTQHEVQGKRDISTDKCCSCC